MFIMELVLRKNSATFVMCINFIKLNCSSAFKAGEDLTILPTAIPFLLLLLKYARFHLPILVFHTVKKHFNAQSATSEFLRKPSISHLSFFLCYEKINNEESKY